MPYVKISDPQIIDLAAWQSIINVVNAHDDSILSLTNNVGTGSPASIDYNGDADFVNTFNPGTQKILYGRTKVLMSEMSPVPDSYGQIVYKTIDFNQDGSSVFNARPIMTASIQFGHSSISALGDKNYDVMFSLFNVNANNFSFRINRAIAEPDEANSANRPAVIPANNTFYLNWSALGPR
jgi:hypothetical protein